LVTVVGRDSTTTDGLSKGMSILDPEAGLALAAAHGLEVRIVRRPGATTEVYQSPGFRALIATGSGPGP
jgi:thiamine biosynthesis lipoprotein ApbE